MTVHVEGASVSDVLRKLGGGGSKGWISINPRTMDFDSSPRTGYEVSWRGPGESFTRLVDSSAELLAVLKPILTGKDAEVMQYYAEKAEAEKKEKASRAASLKQQIERLKEDLEGLG